LGGKRGRLIPPNQREEARRLIDEAHQSGARIVKACDELGITIRTYERWKLSEGEVDRRQIIKTSPPNKLSLLEQQRIIDTANSPKYCNLPPCKIVPSLADEGFYLASESSFYRILRMQDMLSHRGKCKPGKHSKPKMLVANRPNQVWSWDITYLKTCVAGLFYYLYMVVDIFSRKIVAWTIQHHENSDHAKALMIQACADEKISEDQVTLHSDNGSPMKGATLLATLQNLGVAASFSRPAVSNDNPFSESLFKTLKFNNTYPAKGFSTIEDSRLWVEEFVNWYNNKHRHSGLKFVTPAQRHEGLDNDILLKRKAIYEAARQRNPLRWSKQTRNWDLPAQVILNPDEKALAA
jgi:transposase InsO family protein